MGYAPSTHTCMIIIIVLIAVSLSVALVFLSLFIWSMRSGQYDDTYSPSVRILFDDRKSTGTPKPTGPDGNQLKG